VPTYRFNVPPGWPAPPPGWAPPEGWEPDPSWPPAPPGWQWWSAEPPAVHGRAAVPLSAPGGIPGGFLAGRRRLEEENEELRRRLTTLLGMDPAAVSAEAARLREEVQHLRAEQLIASTQLATLRADLFRTSEARHAYVSGRLPHR